MINRFIKKAKTLTKVIPVYFMLECKVIFTPQDGFLFLVAAMYSKLQSRVALVYKTIFQLQNFF